MAAATDVYTDPARRWITNLETDRWSFNFTNQLSAGETVSAVASAVLVHALLRTTVAGFVVSATAATPAVLVDWNSANLDANTLYRLEVTATLNTGKVRTLVTDIAVV